MVDVELVDEPDEHERVVRPPADEDLPEPDDGVPERPAGLRRRQRLIAALVAVGLLLGLFTARDRSLERQRDEALVAAAAAVPGVVGSLRDPLAAWPARGPVVSAAGVVLVLESVGGRTRTIAHDRRTGAALWTAGTSTTPAGSPLRCPAAIGGGVLLCDVDGRDGVGSPITDEVLGGLPDQLIAVDGATGEVTGLRVLPAGTVGWAATDKDVVVARRVADAIVVERSGALSHEAVWSRSIPLPAGVLARHLRLIVADGLVVLDGPLAAVLGLADGAVRGTWGTAPPSVVRVTTGPLGFTVRTPDATTWYDRSGAAGAAGGALLGEPVTPAVDDGSLGQVVLVKDGGSLLGVDVVGGSVRWSRATVVAVHLRLDGLLLVQDERALRAVTIGSGQQVWSVPAPDPDLTVLSDGVRALVATEGTPGRPGTMTAYRLTDGATLWSAPLPPETSGLLALDGLAVATGERDVVLG